MSASTKTTSSLNEPTFHSLECNGIRRGEMEESVLQKALFLRDYSRNPEFGIVFFISTSEAVSKFKFQSEDNIPSSDATQELKDMEPLFLLLLRRFHVPASMSFFN